MNKHEKHTMSYIVWKCIMSTVLWLLKRTKTEKQEAGKSVSTSEAGRGGRLGTCGASAMVELHCVCISSGSDSSPRQMLTGQTSSQVWKSDFFFLNLYSLNKFFSDSLAKSEPETLALFAG